MTVPVVLVSTRLTRSRLRASPKSEIFAQKPWGLFGEDVSRMLPAPHLAKSGLPCFQELAACKAASVQSAACVIVAISQIAAVSVLMRLVYEACGQSSLSCT